MLVENKKTNARIGKKHPQIKYFVTQWYPEIKQFSRNGQTICTDTAPKIIK